MKEPYKICIKALTNTIQQILTHNGIADNKRGQVLKLCNHVRKQKCFKFQDKIYVQENGLATGAPISSLMAGYF
jgi:hypothetical protein